jgi:hypothetical protein
MLVDHCTVMCVCHEAHVHLQLLNKAIAVHSHNSHKAEQKQANEHCQQS